MANMLTKSLSKHPFHPMMIWSNLKPSFLKLNPFHQVKNPVIFTVYVCSIMTTILYVNIILGEGEIQERSDFVLPILCWLWFTVLFSNFAEAIAEARGKAQADSLRDARRDVQAKKLNAPKKNAKKTLIQSAQLKAGDYVWVEE